jgi:tetratricopeptide (TPR) repeat protein
MKYRIPAIMGGGINEAIQLFKKALQIEPRAPETLLFLSEAYMAAKKYDQARKHLNYLLTMTPLPYQIFETNSTRKDAKQLLAKMEKLKNKSL